MALPKRILKKLPQLAIIFKVPKTSEDNIPGTKLVQMSLGKNDEPKIFTVAADDDYNNLRDCHVVLAKMKNGNSLELLRARLELASGVGMPSHEAPVFLAAMEHPESFSDFVNHMLLDAEQKRLI